jgi:hypothetical protein
VALIRAEAALDKIDLDGDEATGARIVRDSLSEPARLIADNAGVEGAVIVERIRTEGDARGYDASSGEWVDMFKAGILDPAKVTRSALQNAASIAAIIITAESAVVEKPEEEEPAAAGGQGTCTDRSGHRASHERAGSPALSCASRDPQSGGRSVPVFASPARSPTVNAVLRAANTHHRSGDTPSGRPNSAFRPPRSPNPRSRGRTPR